MKAKNVYCHKCGNGDFDEVEDEKDGELKSITTKCTCGEMIESVAVQKTKK